MFEQAVENTKKVEYALNFETKPTEPVTKDINVINKTHAIEDPKLAIQLQQALDQMTKYLEALETRLQPIGDNQPACDHNPPRNHRSNNCELYPDSGSRLSHLCWEYGEFRHFQHDCPQLNYDSQPNKWVAGWESNLYPPSYRSDQR